MKWDDIGTPWDRLTILQTETSWAICAEGEWPDGNSSDEALFNLTLKGVMEAINQRGPYVKEVVWRRPRRETRYFNSLDEQYHPGKEGE